MKFSNGYWLLRDDVQARYAVEAESFDVANNALTIYAPTKRIQQRGDTLSQAMLTVHAVRHLWRASFVCVSVTLRAASNVAPHLPLPGARW